MLRSPSAKQDFGSTAGKSSRALGPPRNCER